MRPVELGSSSAFGHVAEASLGRRSGLPPVDELSILLIRTVQRRFASNGGRFRGRRYSGRELRCPYQDFATLLRIADPEERAQQPKHLQIRGAAEFPVLHWSSQSSCGIPFSLSRSGKAIHSTEEREEGPYSYGSGAGMNRGRKPSCCGAMALLQTRPDAARQSKAAAIEKTYSSKCATVFSSPLEGSQIPRLPRAARSTPVQQTMGYGRKRSILFLVTAEFA